MTITVAICTWNRAELLDQTLTYMHKLRIPDGVEWELLVVNNNSRDATDDVIARHALQLPIRRLLESRQGHSHARNCALAAARGELIVWTDDDVLVDPEWLAEYVKAADDWPDAAFFGGTVDPWFAVEPPAWLRRHLHLLPIYVITQQGATIRALTAEDSVVGANMAFRTAVLRQFPFNVRLGRVQDGLVGADDTELIGRLRHAQHQGVWVGTARVRHYIPADRLTRTYVRNWYIGAGRTFAGEHGLPAGKTWGGVPRWVLRQYVLELLKSWWYAPLRGPRWIEALQRASRLRGLIQEARMRRRTADSQPDNRASEEVEMRS